MKPITKTFKAGSYHFRENDHSRELFIIQSGTVKVCSKNRAHEIELAQLSCNEPVSTINGSLFWDLVESSGLSDSYGYALIILKENNLLSCDKNETVNDQSQNPLASFLFKINNNNWEKTCLYSKYQQSTPE